MFIINKIKKCAVHIRTSIKFTILLILAAFLVVAIVGFFFKPIYSVTFNGEFLGYAENKSQLQTKINDYIQKGDGENVAFVQLSDMPEYRMCLLKKDIDTTDEEIYTKVIDSGVPYYKYYAILDDGQEKYYLANFEEAEKVVNELKEKNSVNKEEVSIQEKYETAEVEFTEVEKCVEGLYEKPVVKTVKKASNSGGGMYATGMNASGQKVNIGISLIRPVSGTITSRFGPRSRNNHKGIDIGAPKGTGIKAAASGTVVLSQYGYNGGYGNYVIVSHGNGVQTVYGHCSSLVATVGQKVSQGQVIARVGSTGVSTGNHLHFEIRVNGVVQNPQNYVY